MLDVYSNPGEPGDEDLPDEEQRRAVVQADLDDLSTAAAQESYLESIVEQGDGTPLPSGLSIRDGSDTKGDKPGHPFRGNQFSHVGMGVEGGVSSARENYATVDEAAAKYATGNDKALLEAILNPDEKGIEGVSAIEHVQAVGIWEGKMEPSHLARFTVTKAGAELSWAAKLGSEHNQDAVMLFRQGVGGNKDTIQRLSLPREDADRVIQGMLAAGLKGASYDTEHHELRIACKGDNPVATVRKFALAHELDLLTPERGLLKILARKDYPKYLAKAETVEGVGPGPAPYECSMTIGGVYPGWMHE